MRPSPRSSMRSRGAGDVFYFLYFPAYDSAR